jgi:hypothetical protein
MFLEQYDLFGAFFKNFKKVTGVWLFFGQRTFVGNIDILCDDPQFFSAKNKFSRVVLLKYLNFDFFTNKTVQWPKFAWFYKSFDRCWTLWTSSRSNTGHYIFA